MTMSIVCAILAWICFGFATMAAAERKGFNKGLGFIIGFLFGIFGLLVVAIIPSKNERIMERYIEECNKEEVQ